MNRIKSIIVLILVLLSVNSVFAFESSESMIKEGAKLNLSECIKIALNNSPNIKKAAYNYKISKNDVSLAKSGFFPTLGLGTGYYWNGTYMKNRDVKNNYYSLSASLNQLIWNFGKTNSQIKMQKFYRIASMYNFDNTVLETIFDVKTKYYAVLAAKATMDINKSNVEINERNYQRTKAYFDEGIRSKIDLVNAEVNLSDSKIVYVESVKAYENSLVSLNNAMYVADAPAYEITPLETFNYNVDKLIPVNLDKISEYRDISKPPTEVQNAVLTSGVEKLAVLDNYQFKPFNHTFKECVDLAMKNRPDLRAFEATVGAMKQALKYTKREYLPDITGSVGYGYRDHTRTNSLNASIGMQTNVNIVQEKFKIDNSKLQVQLAENDFDLAKKNVYFELQTAYINMIQLEKEIPLMAVKVRQTKENFELADGRYAVGLGDYIELQDAKQNYNVAQNTYVHTVYNYGVARANLEKLMAIPQEITITVED
ncbi:TolC family protein [bacterium]|nr:TolC family protein [bacterium]